MIYILVTGLSEMENEVEHNQ